MGAVIRCGLLLLGLGLGLVLGSAPGLCVQARGNFSEPYYSDVSAKMSIGLDALRAPPFMFDSEKCMGLTVDVDGDGLAEIILYASYLLCSGDFFSANLIFKYSDTKYRPLNFGEMSFFNLPSTALSSFVAARSHPSALPDIFGCNVASKMLTVLANLGSSNFSSSPQLILSPLLFPCEIRTVMVSSDSDLDGSDEVFISRGTIGFSVIFAPLLWYTRLPNNSMITQALIVSPSPLPNMTATMVSLGDLDGDALLDLVWGGFDGSVPAAFVMKNNGTSGRFALVHHDLAAVFSGSVMIDRFVGGAGNDLALSGANLVGSNGILTVYRNFPPFNFTLVASLTVVGSHGLIAASAPVLGNAAAADIVAIGNWASSGSGLGLDFFKNIGNGTFEASKPSQLRNIAGDVFRGPDVLGSPTLIAFGRGFVLPPVSNGMVAAYGSNGQMVDALSNLMLLSPTILSVTGTAVSLDSNYDGCTDIAIVAQSPESTSNFLAPKSVLLISDCTSGFVPSSTVFPAYSYGVMFAEDFNSNGLVDLLMFASTFVNMFEFYVNGTIIELGVQQHSSLTLLWITQMNSGDKGDYTGDGLSDVILSGRYSSIDLFQHLQLLNNLGNSTLVNVTSPLLAASYRVCFPYFIDRSTDPDSPLFLDIVFFSSMVYYYDFQKTYLWNERNGTFSNRTSTLFSSSPSLIFPLNGGVCEMDVNGDGLLDLFTNGYISSSVLKSYILLRQPNGTLILGASLPDGAHLNAGSCQFEDFDGDGDADLLLTGSTSVINPQAVTSVSRVFTNNGSGVFADSTLEFFGDEVKGFIYGSVLTFRFSSKESLPSVFSVGISEHCGPMVLSKRVDVANVTTTSLKQTMTSAPPDSGSSFSDLGAVLGGVLGGGGALLLVLALLLICVLCCCCICVFVAAAAMVLLAALVLVVAVVVAGAVGTAETGTIVYLLKRRRSPVPEFEDDDDLTVDVESLHEKARKVNDYHVIDWVDIRFVRKLGDGAFGAVMLAEWRGVEVAVKIAKNASRESLSEFEKEAVMMAKVAHHPNVVRFFGVSFRGDSIAVVLQMYAGGSLLDALQSGRLSAEQKQVVLRDVASAVSFLHSLGIVHRDIAARNVLLDARGAAKLSDFGMSRALSEGVSEQSTNSDIGPVRWMAPEAISGHKYSAASDAYSFAVLMTEVWADGALPFKDICGLAAVAVAIVKEGARPTVPEATPALHLRLIRQLWSESPADRLTMLAVYQQLCAGDEVSSVSSGSQMNTCNSYVYSTIEE